MYKIPVKYLGISPLNAPVLVSFAVRRASGSLDLALVVGCSRSDAARVLWSFRKRRRNIPPSSRVLFSRLPSDGVSLAWLACRSCSVKIEHRRDLFRRPYSSRFYFFAPPLQAILSRFG